MNVSNIYGTSIVFDFLSYTHFQPLRLRFYWVIYVGLSLRGWISGLVVLLTV